MNPSAAAVLALGLLTSSACAQLVGNESAEDVIAYSRQTTQTYSLFAWNIITRPEKAPEQEWSAEFHQGSLHRVETPRDRIVANCAELTGTYLQVATGEVIEGPNVARAACGIQANSSILEARLTGSTGSKFGHVQSILVRDSKYIRTYDIASNGAIVGSTIDDLESNRLLKSFAVDLLSEVPNGIFTKESLASTAVPEKYKYAPVGK